MTPKQHTDKWAEFLKVFVAMSDIDPNETDEARDARKKALEADPEAWFNYYFPQYAFSAPATFHKEATQRVLANPEFYEVRIWSRELAKSTRTMLEVLYLVLVGDRAAGSRRKKKYVLVISNSLDNAIRLLMPYKTNLECNEKLIHDYGQQEQAGKWQAAELTTRAGAAFRALGVGQSPRGTRNEEARPDIILFDDIDTDADCLNPGTVAKKWNWIEEAAIGTRSISRPTTIIFCGNLIATDSCMARAMPYADHISTVNIRDAGGCSSWPEKNSEEDIDRVIKQKSYASAQKEYFNNPVTEGSVFKELTYSPVRPMDEYDHLVCYTDPSYTDTGDFKATVLVGRWQDQFHVIKCFIDQTTTANMLEWLFLVLETTGTRCQFYMECVFMQDMILKEIQEACLQYKNYLYVAPDKRQKPGKFDRIEILLEPLNRLGKLYFNEAERHNPHMKRLEQQFLAFAAGSRAHDDGPDAVEGAIWMLGGRDEKALHEMRMGKPMRNNRY